MIRAIVRRLWPMDHDVVPDWKPRHRGRPALLAPADHAGATEDWSPEQALKLADALRPAEPEETAAEAAEREAKELAHHWENLEKQAADETTADFDTLGPTLNPLFAAVEAVCQRVLAELRITEADVDEYAASTTASHDLTELRRLIGVAS